MELTRRFNLMLALTAFVASMAFAVADGNMMLALLAGPIIGCAFLAGRRATVWALPRLIVNILVLAAIWNAAFRTLFMRTDDPIVSYLGEFLTFITIIKLFDRRSVRDDAQSLALTLFLVIASILTSNALDLGLLLVLYIPLAVSTAMMLQLSAGSREATRESAEQAARDTGNPSPPSPLRAVVTGHGVIANLTLVTLTAIVGTTAVASAVFVLAPRGFATEVLGRFGRIRESSVGFTDRIRLGQSGLLSDDPTPVFDVELLDASGQSVGSADESVYLRAAVRGRYNPGTREWEDARSADEDRRARPVSRRLAPDSWCTLGPLPTSPVVRTLKFRFRRPINDFSRVGGGGAGGPGGWLFTAWRPTQIKFDQEAELGIDDETLMLRVEKTNVARLSYELRVVLNDAEPVGAPEGPASFGSAKVAALAATILADRGVSADAIENDPIARRAAVLAMRDWLRESFTYTLDLEAPPGELDPIEWFLFEYKRGHCEYFASALAALCQSVGIHARIVAGFVAVDFNGITNAYLVRQSNAHAWTEVHLGDGRWQAFDATPPNAIDQIHRPVPGIVNRLRQWWEVLEFNWSTSVVGFDAGSQGRLFRSTSDRRGMFEDAIERLRGVGRWIGERLKIGELGVPPEITGAVPFIVVGAITAFFIGRFALRRWSSMRLGGGRSTRTLDPELRALLESARFYPRALRLLRKRGLGKPGHMPPLAHAESIRGDDPSRGRSFDGLSRLYYKVRFGRAALSPDEANSAERFVEELRSTAAADTTRA